jgi:outer membrane receptor protein involved in Fe transport
MDDIKTGGQLSDKLNGRLYGVNFINYGGRTTTSSNEKDPGWLIVVDGIVMSQKPAFDINSLGPNDVETVEVLKYNNAAIYGMAGGGGVLVFTTKQGKLRELKDIPSFGILPITARGYYKAKVFYSPKYDNLEANVKKKDLRSTIYWNPDLVTDDNGNAAIDYYNADGPGTYRMVIEGIDEKGNIGRRVYRYIIK